MERTLFLLAVLTLSCVHASEQPPGYPLYPTSGGRPPRDQVAELVASMPGGASFGGGSEALIKKVDGRDVASLDSAFELMPGCHIVQTSSRLHIADTNTSWRGEIGSRTLAFPMKAGNTYVVKLELLQSGPSARVLVYGIEQNAVGEEVQRIEPAKSQADLRACMTPSASTVPRYRAPDPRAGG